jgi:hypothetical protein
MGPLRESGGLSIGKGGDSDVDNRHLQCCSPICVVKDRDVDTREQVLNVLITYWRYEPNKPM